MNIYLQELVRLVENGLLYVAHDVAVLTYDFGESHLPDLSELSFAELSGRIPVFVPKAVALFQLLELDADDASKGWPNESPLQRGLTQASSKQVDVFHAVVYLKIDGA